MRIDRSVVPQICATQGIRLMHLCEYHYADVVLTLAYASVYFRGAALRTRALT